MSRYRTEGASCASQCIPLVSRGRATTNVVSYTAPSESPTRQSKVDKSLSFRLKRRKKLLNRRQMIVNVEFVLELIGFFTMLTTTEFYIQKVYPNSSNVVLVLKLVISSSTFLLMVAVFMYHYTGLKLIMNDKNVEDWRMVITPSFVFSTAFELIICSIHPIPGDIRMRFTSINGQHGEVSIDAILSILMLLRLYIVAKFVMLHSQWMVSTSMQSIGALNKVEIDAQFILRCLMKDYPGMLIVSIMFGIFITNSWAMRTCESYYVPDKEQSGFLDSMWLVSITFLTVGYGDLSPNSYCGRVIAAETGLMGVAITAMLVTVMTSKFGQTRAERYVHAFMARINLEKKKKDAASDIIKFAMMNWMMNRRNKLTQHRKIMYQMKLSRAVNKMQEIHHKNLAILENSIGIIEVATTIENVSQMLMNIKSGLTNAASRDKVFEARLMRIDNKLNAIMDALQGKSTDRRRRYDERDEDRPIYDERDEDRPISSRPSSTRSNEDRLIASRPSSTRMEFQTPPGFRFPPNAPPQDTHFL